MTTITQSISSLGDVPTTADPATFDTRADTFLGTSLPTLRTEINTWAGQANTVAGEVNTNATTASAAAVAAVAAQAAAEAASNAVEWVSGTTYATGDVVWSPIDFLSYRANTTTSGTTDPSLSVDWTLAVPAAIGAGGTTATGSVVLTSSSPAMQSITTTAYGQTLTLPDATTMDKGVPLFGVNNKGVYPLVIVDDSGERIAMIGAQQYCVLSLSDSSTAAGGWDFSNKLNWGPVAEGTVTFAADQDSSISVAVTLDSTRTMLIVGDSARAQAVVYDASANSFGAPTLVRTGSVSGTSGLAARLAETDEVLVLTCVTTALEAVILSVSGTTITVNTPATATLASSMTNMIQRQDAGILKLTDSYVFSYTRTGTVQGVRAVAKVGVTLTIGSENTQTGTSTALPILFDAGSNVVMAFSYSTGGNVQSRPMTVSGSTLTTGTESALGTTANTLMVRAVGTRWHMLYNDGTNVRGTVVSLTGTVASSSSVTLSPVNYSTGCYLHPIGTTQSICIASDGSANTRINVLTDTAGVASAGTAVAVVWQTTAPLVYAFDSESLYVRFQTKASDIAVFTKITVSGAGPVVSTVFPTPSQSAGNPAFLNVRTLGVENVGDGRSIGNYPGLIKSGIFRTTFPSISTECDVIDGYPIPAKDFFGGLSPGPGNATIRESDSVIWSLQQTDIGTANRQMAFVKYEVVA